MMIDTGVIGLIANVIVGLAGFAVSLVSGLSYFNLDPWSEYKDAYSKIDLFLVAVGLILLISALPCYR